jgi:hypothetical protein
MGASSNPSLSGEGLDTPGKELTELNRSASSDVSALLFVAKAY